jgi:hypothetical protein
VSPPAEQSAKTAAPRKKVGNVKRRGGGSRASVPLESSSTQPSPPLPPPPVEPHFELAPAMLELKGRSLPILFQAIGVCLFKPGLTLSPGSSRWCETGPESDVILRTRRDLIHALLGVSSSNFFLNDRGKQPDFVFPLKDFPFEPFIESLARAVHLHVKLGGENQLLADLVRNSIALATRLFVVPEFRESMGRVSSEPFLTAFVGKKAFLTTSSPFSFEAVSLLYMVAISQNGFLKLTKGKSNAILAKVLKFAQDIYDKRGFCYVHSILISIILLMFVDDQVVINLSSPSENKADGSYGDVILNGIMNICDQPEFWPSLTVIFYFMAPHVRAFSCVTADRVMKIFKKIWKKQNLLVPLFLDAFATILRRTESAENHFLTAFVNHADLIDEIDLDDRRSAKALPILKDFFDIAEDVMEEKGVTELTNQELLELLEEVNLGDEEAPLPIKAPHRFEGEMETTWSEWADLLFLRCFKDEIQKMQEFQAAYAPVLKEHLAQAEGVNLK